MWSHIIVIHVRMTWKIIGICTHRYKERYLDLRRECDKPLARRLVDNIKVHLGALCNKGLHRDCDYDTVRNKTYAFYRFQTHFKTPCVCKL